MSERWDLLIVGGGPAGLSLAILARQLGMSVGVLEAVAHPRVSHGNTLPPGIERHFEAMGIERDRLYRDAIPYDSYWLRWNPDMDFISPAGGDGQSPAQGLQIPRHILDVLLEERAQEVGVRLVQPCTAKRPIQEDNRLAGIATDRGEFFGRFVVDAGGGRHWLARKLRIPMEYYSPTLHGYFNWARGHCEACLDRPLIYSEPAGWTWIARVGPDLYQCTRLTFEAVPDYRNWLPPEFQTPSVRATGATRGADMTWRIVERPAGPGYFVVGDALRRNDLMMTRGIELAMLDAHKVAQALDHVSRNSNEAEIVHSYAENVKGTYLEGLADSYRFLRTHPRPPDWVSDDPACFRKALLST